MNHVQSFPLPPISEILVRCRLVPCVRFWYGTNRIVNHLCKGNGTMMQINNCPLNACITQIRASSQFNTVFWDSEKFWAPLKYTKLIKLFEKDIMLGEDRNVRTSSVPLCRSGTTPAKASIIFLSISILTTKESRQRIKGYHISHYFFAKTSTLLVDGNACDLGIF